MGSIASAITNERGKAFNVGEASFLFVDADFQRHKTNASQIVILKPPAVLRSYDSVIQACPAAHVLEFGIFEGGSAILFALAYPEMKYVGIDFCDQNETVVRYISDHKLADRVRLYYNTSQDDADRIDRIIRDEFPNGKLGVVIDDASHDYLLSRKTFEITFGQLATGGVYCLEDWYWSHLPEPYQTQQWADRPALSNLVFEILIMYGSTEGYISSFETRPAMACIHRGPKPLERFQIDHMLRMRGKKLTLI